MSKLAMLRELIHGMELRQQAYAPDSIEYAEWAYYLVAMRKRLVVAELDEGLPNSIIREKD